MCETHGKGRGPGICEAQVRGRDQVCEAQGRGMGQGCM